MALIHAIMAFIADRPCSGYDLSKELEDSVGCYWMATYQQVYRELAKLESLGWICSQTIRQECRPDKKLYSLTQQGQKQLVDWIPEPSELTAFKDDLLVKILAGNLVEREVILQELERRRQYHLEKLSFLKNKEQQTFPNFPELLQESKFHYLILRRGIRYHADWIAWCDESLELLR
jgi:DNA-binding PadR family transcriptional regulator